MSSWLLCHEYDNHHLHYLRIRHLQSYYWFTYFVRDVQCGQLLSHYD